MRVLARRWLSVLALFVAAALPLAQVGSAAAQHTGGSFGGGGFGGSHSSGGFGGGSHSSGGFGGGSHSSGGFGGGSHSSGGFGGGSHSSGGFGGSSSHSYGGTSGSSYGGGYRSADGNYRVARGSDGFVMGLAFFVFMLVVVVKLSGAAKSNNTANLQRHYEELTTTPLAHYAPLVDVSAIHLALDWRARPALQKRLEELARGGHTGSPGGLAHLLHETVIALRRSETSWLYAGAVNALPTPAPTAEQTFRKIAADARVRFVVESVRAVDGVVASTAAPEMRARADEGPGLVVVTLVVAATREIPDIARATDAHQLHELLRELGSLTARDMIALEVIWSPSAANDRLSSAELEVLYPDMHRIDENTVVGRVFCGYCAVPFPAELLRCPSCGAPGSEAKRALS